MSAAARSAITPNLGLNVPDVGGDEDVWGDETNANWLLLDDLVMQPSQADARYLKLTGGILSGLLTLDAGLSFGTQAASSNSDLSLHLALLGETFGFNVAGGRLNYNADPGATHAFLAGGTDIATIGAAAAMFDVPTTIARSLTVGLPGTSGTQFVLSGAPAAEPAMLFQAGNSTRWLLGLDSGAESGSNAGSSLFIEAYSDAGAYLNTPLTIARANGAIAVANQITLGVAPTANMHAATKTYVDTGLGRYLPLAGGIVSGALTVQGLLTATTTLAISSAGAATLQLFRPSGSPAQIFGYTGSASARWALYLGDAVAESGSNVGSNFQLLRFNDAGAYLDSPITINRASAAVAMTGGMSAATVTSVGGVYPRSGQSAFALGGSGVYISFAPNWYWDWSSVNGSLGYFSAATGGWVFSIDGQGNGNFTGGLSSNNGFTSNYIRSSGSMMVASGIIYVADNTAYYFGRSGADGIWRIVQNGGQLWQVDTAANMQAQGSITAFGNLLCNGAVVAQQSVQAMAGNMVMASGLSGRYISFGGASWSWDWNANNGTLDYYTTSGPMFYFRTTDWLCYANIGVVGGMGPYYNASDGRFKEDIEDAPHGLDEILRLRPVRFTRKSRGRNGARPAASEIGFIAQEVRDVIPEAVGVMGAELEDGSGGLESSEPTLATMLDPMFAAMVNSIKTLTARIIALETKGNA